MTTRIKYVITRTNVVVLLEQLLMNDPAMCHTEYSGVDDTSTIIITGRFDVTMDEDFFSCYENISAKTIILDMSGTKYMDDSALGMLLVMRKRLGGDKIAIELRHCSAEVKKLLQKANYQWLFDIQQQQF